MVFRARRRFRRRKVAIVEDDGCCEMPPKGIDLRPTSAGFKSTSYWKEEQSRISSEVTFAFFHETLATFQGEHCLARKVVWGAVNLCLIDLVQQAQGQFRDEEFHRKILMDMAQLFVLYTKQSLTLPGHSTALTPPEYVMNTWSIIFAMEYDTPVRSNDWMLADCHKQAKRVHEALLARDYFRYATELTLLCRIRTWFLVYYDRTIATYEKCGNILKTLGYYRGGTSHSIKFMLSEHCSRRKLMHKALVENQADLRPFQNPNSTTGLARQMISTPPAVIRMNA
jgi:hypothetical protein